MASCSICDKPAQFRCSRCKVERYCSRECQKDHWPHHKTRCAQLAATGKALPSDRPAVGSTVESTARRLLPQPPGVPLQPQPPMHPTSRHQSGTFRNNPRSMRLLGELPPSLQPETPEQAAVPADPATETNNESRVVIGVTAVAERGNTGNCWSTPTRFTGGSSAGSVEAVGLSGDGSGEASLTPTPPSPPEHLVPRHPQFLSPSGPITPLALQPVPPPGSPHVPSGGASLRHVRTHLRDSTMQANGDLHLGSSVLSRNGGSGVLAAGGGSGRSILDRDRILPPSPPLTPGRAVDTMGGVAGTLPAEHNSASRRQQQSTHVSPQIPLSSGADALVTAAGDDSGAASIMISRQEELQHAPQWPWAARSAVDTKASAKSGASAVTPSLSDLPQEVLLEVLKALPARSLAAAAAVCRSWRRAAREPWLWVRQLCAAGYPLPAAAYIAQRNATPATQPSLTPKEAESVECVGAVDAGDAAWEGPGAAALRAVPGVRGIRAVRAVRAAGGSSHEDFLGGLRSGFLDRLQQQQQQQQQGQQGQHQQQGNQGQQIQGQGQHQTEGRQLGQQPQPQLQQALTVAADLKGLYGRTLRIESNWQSARYAEMPLREHSSNVECLAFQRVEPWGSVLLSAAWDGSVRVFSLGPASGAPQQARCVRRYRGHTGWITCMAAGRHQVVTASTDRRVAAWRYYSESSDPWVALEHPQEVTLVRFCYAPPPPATTHYLAHHICERDRGDNSSISFDDGNGNGGAKARPGGGAADDAKRAPSQSHASAPAALGPAGAEELSRVSYCSAEAMSMALPYDPQLEDWVVTGCIDGVIRLWHLPTKQLLRIFSGHSDVVWGIAVLYGSSVMVSSSRDCTTKLWQLPLFSAMQDAIAPPPPSWATEGAVHGGGGRRGSGGGGGRAEADAVNGATRTGPGAQTLDAMATLRGHTSAILCMDVYRGPPGLIPPSTAAARATAAAASATAEAAAGVDAPGTADDAGGGGDGAGGRAQINGGMGTYDDVVNILSYLLNTGLVEVQGAAGRGSGGAGTREGGGGSSGGDSGGEELIRTAAAAKTAAAGAAGMLPTWLVATGGADAVVRVWNPATAQCHTTLRGHSFGVLSVQFGYLPRYAESYRDQLMLPPNLDISSAAAPPPLALPPGQYGRRSRAQRLPPSQRLVLVTGSVREVRVWDPIAGTALVQLSDHNGPVTSVAMVHGAVVTLAMNDGLIVYKCNGLDGLSATSTAFNSSDIETGAGAATGALEASSTTRPASAVGRLRQEVIAQRRVLEPVICMQDAPHHSFAAALAVQLDGLAVGSGTGDITYLDFRPRASPLPVLNARRRLL